MSFIYIVGRVNLNTYKEVCQKNGHDPSEKNCVFIFPGNASHHLPGTTLFSLKSGGGLAAASAELGKAGYPTLSLPTTSMEEWSTNTPQQIIVHGAIEDLYRAVGAGYHIVLPIRDHHDTDYFEQGLFPDGDWEPSFWGGIQTAANKELANYYIQCLDDLYRFMDLSVEDRRLKAHTHPENSFYQTYLDGRRMAVDDPWLK